MTADCRDDKGIKKQFRRQNTVGNMLVMKFSFEPVGAKIKYIYIYIYIFLQVILLPHLWMCSLESFIPELY